VGFRLGGEMNMGRLKHWLSILLKEKGTNLFRYKGVLAVKGLPQKWIFQVRICMSVCGWVWVLGSGCGVYTCVYVCACVCICVCVCVCDLPGR
jgi:hypothetical protein